MKIKKKTLQDELRKLLVLLVNKEKLNFVKEVSWMALIMKSTK